MKRNIKPEDAPIIKTNKKLKGKEVKLLKCGHIGEFDVWNLPDGLRIGIISGEAVKFHPYIKMVSTIYWLEQNGVDLIEPNNDKSTPFSINCSCRNLGIHCIPIISDSD